MFSLARLAILSTAALSVAAMPSHFARHPHNHREIAARVPQPEALPVVEVAARDMSVPSKRMLRRRGGSNGRCKTPDTSSPLPSPTPSQDPQPSSDPTPPASTPEVKGNIGVDPNNTPSEDPKQPTPTPDNNTPTPTPSPTPTPTSDSPAPTPTSDSGNNSGNNSGNSSGGGQTYTGQGTFYSTGLGACGITNNDNDYIAAVSHAFFDSFPGSDGNPNHNPLCGKSALVKFQDKTVTVSLTDRCEGCAYGDLDFSPAAFSQLADFSLGRIDGISWHIL